MARGCLFALLVLLAGTAALAQTPSAFPNVTDAVKKVFGGSNMAPFTRELKGIPESKKIFAELTTWFEAVSADVSDRRNRSDGSECTLRGQNWIENAEIYMQNRRLKPPNKGCATRTEHNKRADLNAAFSVLSRASKLFNDAGNKVVANDPEIKMLWKGKKAYPFAGLRYEADDQRCTLDYATAVKSDDQWYVIAAVTSPSVLNVGRTRTRIVEHVHQNFSAPLVMTLSSKEQKSLNKVTPRTGKFTTVFAESVGAAGISRVTDMQFDDNRALSAALQANILAVDQATDALTNSNFSILVLPLLMSFIPVALIADVSDIATFFYVLLTDVFAAIPFVIKGIELVQTGTTITRSAETWLVGEVNGVQVAETWAAKCSPQDRFRTLGLIVILVGVSAILLGIFIEHFARKWMSYRRQKGERPEPFGPALLRMDAYIPVGANFMPHDINYEDELTPNHAADFPPPPPPAAGPVQTQFTSLFSGLLRRRAPQNIAYRGSEEVVAPQAEVPRDAGGNGGMGNATFSNFVGIMRRRSNAQHPDHDAEYDEA